MNDRVIRNLKKKYDQEIYFKKWNENIVTLTYTKVYKYNI